MEEICSQIRGLHLQFPRSAIWFAGDANFPDIKRDRNTVCGDSYKHQSAVLRHHSWYRIWIDSEISHTRKNILDLFVTNRPSLIYMCKPLPGLSGHDTALVEAKVLASRKKDLPVKQANTEDVSSKIKHFADTFTSENSPCTDVNMLWSTFKTCSEAIDSCVLSMMSSSRFHQPWIKKKIKRLSGWKKRA